MKCRQNIRAGAKAKEAAARSSRPSVIALTAPLLALMAGVFIWKGLQDRAAAIAYGDAQVSALASETALAAASAGEEEHELVLARNLEALGVASQAAALLIDADGAIQAAAGDLSATPLDRAQLDAIRGSSAGAGEARLNGRKILLAWRSIPSTDYKIIVAAPARALAAPGADFFTGYGLIFVGVVALFAALLLRTQRQSSELANIANQLAAESSAQNAALDCGATYVWRADRMTGAIFVPAATAKRFGLGDAAAAVPIRRALRVVAAKDRRRAAQFIRNFEDKPSWTIELALRTGQGRIEPFVLRGGVLRKGAHSLIYGVATAAAPQAGSSAAAARRDGANGNAIANILEAAPAAIAVLSGGEIVLANSRFCDAFQIEHDFRSGDAASLDEIGKTSGPSFNVLREFLRKDDMKEGLDIELADGRWVRLASRRTAGGDMILVATDISSLMKQELARQHHEFELKRTVADLQKSRAEYRDAMSKYEQEKIRAEEASRSKSEFLANMSHELRTPLNAINGFSEIMHAELYGPLGDPKYKEYARDIRASGQHLLELIDDILDMSKIEAGKFRLEFERVDLEQTLIDCIRLIEQNARERNIDLDVTASHIPTIWGDMRAVKQIILNIATNALKFTPPGGQVQISSEADLDGVTLYIVDNGVGIAEDNLHRLGAPFEQFEVRLDTQNKGSGLGLALCKSLMGMHRGALMISSSPGVGTKVSLTFPRRSTSRVQRPAGMPSDAHILVEPEDAPFALQAAQ